MATSLLTIGGITKRAIAIFRNSNAFLQMIDKQYDPQYAIPGGKIGSQLRIRLPNEYVLRNGPNAVAQQTIENQVTLNVSTFQGVDVSFTSTDLALSMDDFAYRILAPMVNVLAGGVAVNIMGGVDGIPSLVHATTTGATVTPTITTILQAGAVLDLFSCPKENRNLIVDAVTQSRVLAGMQGQFNPQAVISDQYRKGLIGQNVLGFDWAMDQTVPLHTEGTFTTGTVSATANQTGNTITVTSTGGTLNVGDIITFANVFQVNKVNKTSTGNLQQFVITVAAPASSTSLSIYPALMPQVASTNVANQTVVTVPSTGMAAGAAITSPVAASETYRKSFAFHPTACTLATCDLELPTGAVVQAGREAYDGVSLRMIRDYNSTTDVWLTRLDILYGWVWVRPEWAVIIADAV